jgi:hypothetical protein
VEAARLGKRAITLGERKLTKNEFQEMWAITQGYCSSGKFQMPHENLQIPLPITCIEEIFHHARRTQRITGEFGDYCKTLLYLCGAC